MRARGSRSEAILHPPLPYRMGPRADRAVGDIPLRQFVDSATMTKFRGRVQSCHDAFGDNYDAVRSHAGAIKQHTLDHLDHYLEQFIDRAEAAGVVVHYAADGDQANAICLDLVRQRGLRRCVKSKSMVTEEIRLLPELERAGVETLETDLGEFIIQLDHDAPSHIVTPMIHKDRRSVARAFQREIGAEYTEDPERLTRIAREYMRRKYREADLGISGANFLIAESGSIVLCTNEGNADFVVNGPDVHIVFAGIEKVTPNARSLSVFLKLLARSATAQPLTVYTTLVHGPRSTAAHDGPRELHVILLDGGRTELLRSESRELLRCIRCGACLNACPVYRKGGGGHTYGAVYSGPIGAVITPAFQGLANYADLPNASSLCGACFDACPVHIDIPKHLVRLRESIVNQRIATPSDRLMFRLWTSAMRRRWSYELAVKSARSFLRSIDGANESSDPLCSRRWISRGPGPLGSWTRRADFPAPPTRNFRDWWRDRQSGGDQRP